MGTRDILLVQIVLFALVGGCKKGEKEVAASLKDSFSHLEELRSKSLPAPEVFEFDATVRKRIETGRNTVIRIPANSFRGKEKITLKVTETVTPAQGASLGVPMRDVDGHLFQSDGMFRLDTNGVLTGKSGIQVSMIAKSNRPMNVYAWIDGKWVFRGKNQLARIKSSEDQENRRSFTGVEPNTLYNFDVPIEPNDESCVTIKVPSKHKRLLLSLAESDGRSFDEVLVTNTDKVSIRFLKGAKVDLKLFGPDRLYWEKNEYKMSEIADGNLDSKNCETLVASFQKLPALPGLKSMSDEEFSEGLKRIKQKFGRIARIETKTGEQYIGYFNQKGARMRIETPRGTVDIFVADVQKVTPMN